MPVTGHKNTCRRGQRGTQYHNETPRQRQDSSASWPVECWLRFSLAWSKDFFPLPSGNTSPAPDPGRHRECWQRNSRGACADRLCKSNRKAINISSRYDESFQVSLTVNIGGLLVFTARRRRRPPATTTKTQPRRLHPSSARRGEGSGRFCSNCTCRNQQPESWARLRPPRRAGCCRVTAAAPASGTRLERGKAFKIRSLLVQQ